MPHGEQTLELTVEGGRLTEIRWGGLPVKELTTAPYDEALTPADHQGAFGIYVAVNGGVFRNARFMRLAPRN